MFFNFNRIKSFFDNPFQIVFISVVIAYQINENFFEDCASDDRGSKKIYQRVNKASVQHNELTVMLLKFSKFRYF